MAITEFEDLKDQYIDKLIITGEGEDTRVFFYMLDLVYELRHFQECCEDVELVDICGDVSDFENAIIHRAECNTRERNNGELTYSFYRLDSDKGSLVLRWTGTSNGCYSQEVDFGVFSPYRKDGDEYMEYENYMESLQWSPEASESVLAYKAELYAKQLECLGRG